MYLIITFIITFITSATIFATNLLNQQEKINKEYEKCEKINNILHNHQIYDLILQTKNKHINHKINLQKKIYKKLKTTKLELTHPLNINNYQETPDLNVKWLKIDIDLNKENSELQDLKNTIKPIKQKETEKTNKNKNVLLKKDNTLPKCIKKQLQINNKLSQTINQQIQYINIIKSQQKKSTEQIYQLKKILKNLIEQIKWIDTSPTLKENLRAQTLNIPNKPKYQQLNNSMSKIRHNRVQFENQINKLNTNILHNRQDDGSPLTKDQKDTLENQLKIKKILLNTILINCDTQIFELTKLKASKLQLEETIKEIKKTTHKHLFWTKDVNTIDLTYPAHVYKDIKKIINKNTIHQLICILHTIFTNKESLILIFSAILLIICNLCTQYKYYSFLINSSKKIGKINRDTFSITIQNIFISTIKALPLPILWMAIAYSLQEQAWMYTIAISLSDAIYSTIIILWILIITKHFSHPKGLFIKHFGWPTEKVNNAFYYYSMFNKIIIPIMIATITFNTYNEKDLLNTLGRLSFISICFCLSLLSNNLKKAGLPLYINKHHSGNNLINKLLWNCMIYSPILAILFSCLGYLTTSQTLLARLESSIFTLILLMIVYHIIRRWMLIQRRKYIAFERTKQKRKEIIFNTQYNKNNTPQISPKEISKKFENKIINLEDISKKSLQLIRSILTIISIISIIFIWSELHPAFSFLEKITLWDVTSTIKGIDNIQPITLNSVLIAILVFIITTKMVNNFPSLLELTILQHLDLTPGTDYAITSLTKYGLMILGGLIGFSLLGIEWSKIQWLIAALGVGLGFGLQEMFANFISGLMILFEKPIRIGDTITIKNLTGNVTKINTRATTITDWDHKEIIIPNKDFITKEFTNWSLSDTITRVVLKIPAPIDIDIERITNILINAATKCELVLNSPEPEVYLIDINNGYHTFEMRLYAATMKHRMPIRHEVNSNIINNYKENGFKLPMVLLQVNANKKIEKNDICNFFINHSKKIIN